MSSLDTSAAGYYKVTASGGINPRQGPYSARATVGDNIAKGTQVKVLGAVKNHFNNTWYQLEVDGKTVYTHENHITFVKYFDQSFTGKITDPTEGEQIPQGKHPVAGTITSKYYPLQEVKAYLDGTCYATVTLGSAYTLDVRSTDINAKLTFGSLSLGKHTLVIKARDTKHSSLVTVCSVTFTTVCSTHSYTSKVTKSATCTAAGVRTYTCSKCSNSYTASIAATGHSYGSWVTTTAATCTTNGIQKSTCSTCGAVKTQSIAATGSHSYGSWTTVKAATCTASGTQQRKCANCSATESKTITATGHSYGSWTTTKAATCTATGTQQRKCANCSATESKTIAATGHSYGNYVTVKEPTCTAEGVRESKCTSCGDVRKLYPVATGHSYTSTVIPATCVSYEIRRYSCLDCGYTYDERLGDTLGAHAWDSGVITTPAACEKEGVMTFTCAVCEATRTQTLAAQAHTYEEGYCIYCSEKDPDYVFATGDIDGDLVVDRNDVIQLLLHVSMPAAFPVDAPADFTGDVQVTRDDVIQLLLHVSMPDLFPLTT